MQVQDDIRKCTAFIGFADNQDREIAMRVVGTGFFVDYEDFGYLVTARHIATFAARFATRPAGHGSFLIRVNHKDGASTNIEATDTQWIFHPDESVEVAVAPFDKELLTQGYDCLYLPQDSLLTKKHFRDNDIEIGDTCYAVRLLRALRGAKRNLPVTHIGSVAFLPGDGKLPVKNPEDEKWLPPQMIDACLVEFQALSGMNGSPVFVRPSLNPASLQANGQTLRSTLRHRDIFLLGMLQGAWDAPATEITSADRSGPIEIPAGMGVVVSSERIIEVLDMPVLKEQRAEANRRQLSPTAAQRKA